MGVAIYQAGYQRMLVIATVDIGAVFFICLLRWQYFQNFVVMNCDRMMFEITMSVIDRDDPSGMKQGINIIHGETIPVAHLECNSCNMKTLVNRTGNYISLSLLL